MNEDYVFEILGKNMHDIRFKKNISLQELAKKTKISIVKLRKFEAGEYSGLGIPDYIKIANSLNVCYEEITKGIQFTEK